MIIIGVDFHPGFQQIVFVDSESGELQEKRLAHREEAESFYRALASTGQKVRVGMEASGYARGDCTSVCLPFAPCGVNERYGDLSPTTTMKVDAILKNHLPLSNSALCV